MRGASALAILAVFTAHPTFGQSPSAASPGGATELDGITVTGEKVERNLKTTASSVSVIPGKDIGKEKAGAPTVADVISGVPNVVYTDTVGAPIIRGQDTQGPNTGQNMFWGGTVPRATINLDGHYLNYYEYYFGATSVWDLKSIEVYRGPQTTSQGANAIAGAIIVNTKDPTFTPEGAYQAEIGSYKTRRASYALSGPIVGDQLAVRFAIDYFGRDTFIDYTNPNFQRGGGTDRNFRSLNARAKALWRPTALPGFEAKLTYSYTSTNRPSQEAASPPFDELNHVTTTMPTWKQQTNTGVLDLSYDFGTGIKLFNQAQYSDSSVKRRTALPGNGDAEIEQKNLSNETRVTFGNPNDTWSGVAGIFYARTKSDEKLYLMGISAFDDTKRNLGLFSELSWRFADQWTLTGGLRYQRDQIERHGRSSLVPQAVDFDKTFSAVLPKVSLAYAVTPTLTVGALVSRGYNPGGVSLNLTGRRWMPFKDESLWNYELFTRASLFDNKLTVSGNLFFMDFKNAQYNIPVVISPGITQAYTVNAEKAHAYGLEVDLAYRPFDNLTLKVGAGLLRTRIDKMSSNTGYKGNEFARSPGYMLNFGASWDATEKLNIAGQVRHLDGYYSDIANTRAYVIKAYTIADVQVSYRFHDLVQVYGYVRNIFDERAATYAQQNRGIGGIEASMTTPRMFGIGLRGSF